VTIPEFAPVPGYICSVSKIHVVELHALPETTATAFVNDARRVSAAIADITQAVKISYEIHGNTIPHLHMHFFPRYRGDRFEGQPINPRSVTEPVYADDEYERIRCGS
jgi:diadenosine tetraphosphate (Ap4A) HIT family hydrolase